jgi:hypothetical protein
MKQSLLLLFALCLATQALYAQQEYQHPSQACGIAYGYDSIGLATGTYYAVIKRSSGIQTLPFVKIKEL